MNDVELCTIVALSAQNIANHVSGAGGGFVI